MGPFKCPDCGIWWAGFEHRCQVQSVDTVTVSPPPNGTYTASCTCSFDAMGRRISSTALCMVHDVRVTYLTWTSTTTHDGVTNFS